MTADSDVTRLLQAAHAGDRDALEALVPRLYEELRELAQACLSHERRGHTLQPTALVHEAWMKIASQDSLGFEHRAQFFAAAATTMRRVLIDHARTRPTPARDADATHALDSTVDSLAQQAGGDLLVLEGALEQLGDVAPERARLVELRFFAGLPMREVAEVLGIPLRRAEREWTTAKAWLRQRMEEGKR